jgi:hypothetical protein
MRVCACALAARVAGRALFDVAAIARLHDGVRPLPFLRVADGHDEAEHAAPRRLALYWHGFVIDRIELHGVRGEASVEQGAAGLLRIAEMVEDTDQGRRNKGAGGSVHGQAF